MTFRADLHCHTVYSDGRFTPQQVVQMAKDAGLNAIAVTDHDTVASFSEARGAAAACGIAILPGIEFSTMHKGCEIHVLGYAFHHDSPLIRHLCERHGVRRERRLKAIIERLAACGFPMTVEEVVAGHVGTVGRLHVAEMMAVKGYVKNAKEAFRKYLKEGQRCYIPTEAFSVPETISVIHEAGGFAVLAHPLLVKKKRVFKDLLTLNFDGIEVYYSGWGDPREQELLALAKKRNLLVTGGSDFHGIVEAYEALGCRRHAGLGASWTPEETFHVFMERYQGQCRNP